MSRKSDQPNSLQMEVRHLRETIGVLRAELENLRLESDRIIQRAVAAANDETIQLKATINALRHELDVQRLDNEAHARQALSAANSEITQLKATVMSLREQLEQYDSR